MGQIIKNLELKDLGHIIGRVRNHRRVLDRDIQEIVGILKRSFQLIAKIPVSRIMGKNEIKETK